LDVQKKIPTRDLEVLKYAVSHPATNLNFVNPITGDTLLHMLCSEWTLPLNELFFTDKDSFQSDPQNRSVLFLLLQAGADPTIKNKESKSCFDILPNLRKFIHLFNCLHDEGPDIAIEDKPDDEQGFIAPKVVADMYDDPQEVTQQQMLFGKLRHF